LARPSDSGSSGHSAVASVVRATGSPRTIKYVSSGKQRGGATIRHGISANVMRGAPKSRISSRGAVAVVTSG
jgi:hypothetical protein